MSPEPDAGQVPCSDTLDAVKGDVATNAVPVEATADIKPLTEECNEMEMLAPRKQRERRIKSPATTLTLLESFVAPISPASSSSTSQGNSGADATFEPSIEMMVNDFDDEQTLNEEEALAAMELQDPQDEIATLKEESEMPLEQLLAKYCAAPPPPQLSSIEPPRKKVKRSTGASKHSKQKQNVALLALCSTLSSTAEDTIASPHQEQANATNDVIVIESGDEEPVSVDPKSPIDEQETNDNKRDEDITRTSTPDENECMDYVEVAKPHRSHLLDLYPDQVFTATIGSEEDKEVPLDVLYEEDEYEDCNDVDEDEIDSDYVKKTIMVGVSYQAVIPDGLSQYGDVLPYENEDKLIWEPRQVSERQVEEYLLKARDIKPSLLDNDEESGEGTPNDESGIVELSATATHNGTLSCDAVVNSDFTPSSTTDEGHTPASVPANENEVSGVIKDNEQALHLLVQCGYDFKEALRRKRLNALPLTGSMSLWSEDECHKFEEGIQKFGKDFLKIRQNQVRTRTMRELVQFYYLWKKSDRRDHNFANADTVDHMDIYLNEGGDYSPNATNSATAAGNSSAISTSSTPPLNTRRNNTCNQKNFSIMMTGSNANSAASIQQHSANNKVTSSRRQRSGVMAAGVLAVSSSNESLAPQSISPPVAHSK